jgi:hypothetical protein
MTQHTLGFRKTMLGAPVVQRLEGGDESGVAARAKRLGDIVLDARPELGHETGIAERALAACEMMGTAILLGLRGARKPAELEGEERQARSSREEEDDVEHEAHRAAPRLGRVLALG